MGSITLTNIPHFVEQPGRMITKSKGSLDRMTVKFLGPYYAQIPFSAGSPDTLYPLMFCIGWREDFNGALKELDVDYAGRTDNDWQNDILITTAASEKELNFSELTTFGGSLIRYYVGGPTPTSATIQNVTYGLNNFCLHYVGEIVTYKYVYYGAPIPLTSDSAQIYSQYIVHTGKGSTVNVTGTPESGFLEEQFPGPYGYSGPHQRLTQFNFQQVIDQWYECTAATEARFEVP